MFCSSNSIWFPNTQEAYESAIVKKDRYEWTNFKIEKAKKVIFLRDIYKSWYVTGINREIDTIDRLIEFVKTEIGGLKLVCIGSSSGGYLATILGCSLQAEHVICFSGQMELKNKWSFDPNPFLQHFISDDIRSKYYDLSGMLRSSSTPVYYICPRGSEQDAHHYEHIKDIETIHELSFKSSHHGVVMYKCDLQKFINLSSDELEKIYIRYKGKRISMFGFSVDMIGFLQTLSGRGRELIHKVKAKA